jgi:hypothetical protein
MSTLLQDLATRLEQGDIASAKSIFITIEIATVLITAISIYLTDRPYKGLPTPGEKTKTIWQAKQRWLSSARELMIEGLRKVGAHPQGLLRICYETDHTQTSNRPFQVVANCGPMIILPPSLMNEIRNDDRMTFKAWLRAVCRVLHFKGGLNLWS